MIPVSGSTWRVPSFFYTYCNDLEYDFDKKKNLNQWIDKKVEEESKKLRIFHDLVIGHFGATEMNKKM